MSGSDGFECLSLEFSLYYYHCVVCVVATSSGVEGDHCVPELCQGGEIFPWSDDVSG